VTYDIPHHSYMIPGITDNQVLAEQAERRRDKKRETTILHAHRSDTSSCNENCRIFEPGYETRSIAVERTPMKGDQS